MTGVVKLVELLNNADPPEAAAYQSMVSPAWGVAEIVTVPVPQREFGIPVGGLV